LKLLIHFLRLIRWPNLVFIILAECLFHFCIYKKLYPLAGAEVDFRFYLMLVSNTFIAAAGYMINDYFDVNIDQVNKPEKVVVGSYISRRWVIFWHLILSVFAIYISSTVFPFKTYWHIHLSNLLAILLLWFYSTTFKKNFLIGNVLISVLTAWSISVVYFSKFTIQELIHPNINNPANFKFAKLTLLYSAFAFILTLVREALKDLEDMEGDAKFGCNTLPIKWGLKSTKVYLSVWLVVVISVLLIIQLAVIPFGWWFTSLYCFVFIITPLAIVLFRLSKSYTSKHFNNLSNWIKVAMLFGIVSIAFFYFLF
jgi:4-hydroxybenzoate polyprenyltransferase